MSIGPNRKELAWLHGEIKTPPFSSNARIEAGVLLRMLQEGESLRMPHSRPMPSIGRGCHELRVRDGDHNWRVIYRFDPDVILILDVFPKTTEQTPKSVIDCCKRRLSLYDDTLKTTSMKARVKPPPTSKEKS